MHLNKLPLALALGVAFAVPAAVAQSSVEIYGRLYPFLVHEDGSGATGVGTTVSTLAARPVGTDGLVVSKGMSAGNSRLGFRGKEDLGGGLRAIFQLETTVSVDSGSANAAQFWNRDTFVGLQSKQFGTVKLGNMDTIFKNYGDTLSLLGISSGTFMSTSELLRKSGFGTSSASSFHLRRPNSIQYETPELFDLVAGVQVSTDESSAPTGNPKLWSMGLRYEIDPIYVAVAHEIHLDFFGASRNLATALRNDVAVSPGRSRDQATQVTVEYRPFKNHRFEVDFIRKEYNENARVTGRFQSYKNNAYLFAMDNRWSDQWRTGAHYVKATAGSCSLLNRACTTDGLGGSKVTAGVMYYLSKRTQVFASASRVTNGKSSRFSGAELNGSPNPGEDITDVALGVVHSF